MAAWTGAPGRRKGLIDEIGDFAVAQENTLSFGKIANRWQCRNRESFASEEKTALQASHNIAK